jgi:hypothetical protein
MSVGIRRAVLWVVSVSLAMLLVTSSARTSQDFTGVSWDPEVDGKYYLDNNPLLFPRIAVYCFDSPRSDSPDARHQYWVDGETRTYTDEEVCRAYGKFDLAVAFDAGPRWSRLIRQYRREWFRGMGYGEELIPPIIILTNGFNAEATRSQVRADPRRWAEENYKRVMAASGGKRLDEGDPQEMADGWYHDQMGDVKDEELRTRYLEAARTNRELGGRNVVIMNNDGALWADYHNGQNFENFPRWFGGWLGYIWGADRLLHRPGPDFNGYRYVSIITIYPTADYSGKTNYYPLAYNHRNTREMRYGLSATLLTNAFYTFGPAMVGGGPPRGPGYRNPFNWFDEFDNGGTMKGYLGKPVEEPHCVIHKETLRQFVARVGREWGGCEECAWMRRFEGGVVYHNPSPSEALTFPLPEDDARYWRIKGAGDWADNLRVNTGEPVTTGSVDVLPADGLILVKRAADGSGYKPWNPTDYARKP